MHLSVLKSMYNGVTPLEPSFLLYLLANYKGIHTSLNEFEFLADHISDCGARCLCASGKIPTDLQWEKCCDHSSAFIFELVFLIFAGNKDNHKSLNGFNFGLIPLWTIYGDHSSPFILALNLFILAGNKDNN